MPYIFNDQDSIANQQLFNAMSQMGSDIGAYWNPTNTDYRHLQDDPQAWATPYGWRSDTPQHIKDKFGNVGLYRQPVNDKDGNPTGNWSFAYAFGKSQADLPEGAVFASGNPQKDLPALKGATTTTTTGPAINRDRSQYAQNVYLDAAKKGQAIDPGQAAAMAAMQKYASLVGTQQNPAMYAQQNRGAPLDPNQASVYSAMGFGQRPEFRLGELFQSNTLVPTTGVPSYSQGGPVKQSPFEEMLSVMKQDMDARSKPVPAVLHQDEFVMPRETVLKYGLDKLEKMRQDGLAMRQDMQQQPKNKVRSFKDGGFNADELFSQIANDPNMIPGYADLQKARPTPGYTDVYGDARTSYITAISDKANEFEILSDRLNKPEYKVYAQYLRKQAENLGGAQAGLTLPDTIPQVPYNKGVPGPVTRDTTPQETQPVPEKQQTAPQYTPTPVSYTGRTEVTPGSAGYAAWGDPNGLDWKGLGGMNPNDVMAALQQEVNRRDTGTPLFSAALNSGKNFDQIKNDQRMEMMDKLQRQYMGQQAMVDQGTKNKYTEAGLKADIAAKYNQMAYNNALINKFNAEAKTGGMSQMDLVKMQEALSTIAKNNMETQKGLITSLENSIKAAKDAGNESLAQRQLVEYALTKNPELLGANAQQFQDALQIMLKDRTGRFLPFDMPWDSKTWNISDKDLKAIQARVGTATGAFGNQQFDFGNQGAWQ